MFSGIASPRQLFLKQVPAAAQRLASQGRFAETNHLKVAIALPLRNQEALSNLVRQVSEPGNPNYRQYLTPAEFARRFGPTESDYQKVINYAKANGLHVTKTSPNRLLVEVNASVKAIEKAFGVRMNVYKHPKEDRTFYAPDLEPSVDEALPVMAVSGLNNYSKPQPRIKKKDLVQGKTAKPNLGSGPNGGYAGADFRKAYAPGVSLTGLGQSVGILSYDGYNEADIRAYEDYLGLPHVPLRNVLLEDFNGYPTGSGGEVEACLDIQMAISMAPGLSSVIVYEDNPWVGNWHVILNAMANDTNAAGLPAAYQLSCSWYSPEMPADPVADQIFMQMAAQGQSFFNAAGDYNAFIGPVDFPGDTPYLTQVGGTFLTTDETNGDYLSETVWNRNNGIGTGGGISTYYPIPSWQQGISMSANGGSTTMRNIPDVALTADDIWVRCNEGDHYVGGTSASAPLWAGYMALVNQKAALFAQPTVGFANPVLYSVAQSNSACFHDITTGDNTWSQSTNRFFAVAGYDLCTGVGTPAGATLLDVLAPGNINAEPIILAQPQSQTVVDGHSASLEVAATGQQPISYRWIHNGTEVTSAGSVLSFRNTRLTDAGTYWVIISNALGTVTSDLAVLTVNPGDCRDGSAGLVSWWKAEDNSDDAMGLNAGVLEGGTFYNWGFVGQSSFAFNRSGDVLVPASASLNVGAVPPGGKGGAFTLEAWINPNEPSGTIFFWTNQQASTWTYLSVGNTTIWGGLSFGGQAYNSSAQTLIVDDHFQHVAMTFDDSTMRGLMRLYVNGNMVGESFWGHQYSTNIYELGTLGDLRIGQGYRGLIDEPAIYNRALTPTEIAGIYEAGRACRCASPTAPTITLHPQSQTAISGHSVTLAVAANGSEPSSLSYQWKCNGTNIDDQIGNALTLTDVRDGGTYSVVVANRAGTVTSSNAVLTVVQPTCLSDTNGLVSWWQLEGNGFDVMGRNPLTPYTMGENRFTDGYIGQGYGCGWGPEYESIAYCLVPESASLNIGQNGHFSADMWIYGFGSSFSFSPDYNAFSWQGGASLKLQRAGNLYACVPLTPDVAITCSSPILPMFGAWQHVAMTLDYDQAQSNVWLRLYLNGAQVGTKELSVAGITNQIAPATTGNLYMGADSAAIIDEPALYNRCLSATEIQAIYDASFAGRSPRAPESITASPSSQTAIEGHSVLFTSAFTGGATQPVSYQWQFNGMDIDMATDNYLRLGNVNADSAGSYTVTMSNPQGTVVSPSVLLTVEPAVCTDAPANLVSWWRAEGDAQDAMGLNPGVFEGDPVYYDGMAGSGFYFFNSYNTGHVRVPASPSMNVGAGGAFTIEGWAAWSESTWGDVCGWAGTNGSPGVMLSASGKRLEGSIDIGLERIWINIADAMPSYAYQHFAITYTNYNTQAVVRVYLNGAVAIEETFNHPGETWIPKTWGDFYMGKNIDGQIDEVCIYNRALTTNEVAAIYNASAAGKCISVTTPPSLAVQPVSQSVAAGQNVIFSVVAGGTQPLSYQWSFNDAPINGATQSELVLLNVNEANAGSYAVVVTNVAGSVTSQVATLTIAVPPSITTQPASQTVVPGANVTFSVEVSGTAPFGYQWKRNGTALGGATSSALSLSSVNAANAGSYTVIVTNAAGSVTSDVATLTVLIAPSIVAQPVSQTAIAGTNVTFTVLASGSAPLSYQWRFNGTPISGATGWSLTLNNINSGNVGSYDVVVTNMAGTVTSQAATLTLLTPPSITTQPASQSVAAGSSVTFNVVATGSAPLNYQWRFNGTNISGATASSLTKSNVQVTDIGSYSVVITNQAGSVTSANATLVVNRAPSLSLGVSTNTENVVNFESITVYTNDAVLFRRPNNSGTTSAFLNTSATNYAMVVTSFPAGNPRGDGSKVIKAGWTFKTGTTNAWLRLTTGNPVYIPNPSFYFTGRIRFDIYSTRSVKLGLGLRETTNAVALGANGGTTGAIEWVGVTNKIGTAPVCTRTITASNWTTVEFSLPVEPCYNFNAGNGVLSGSQGVLEHLAIVPNAGLTDYVVYLDNFQMLLTNSLPTNITVRSGSSLAFTAVGSDPDSGQGLTYSLISPPAGASINSTSGAFTWMPSSGGTTNTINVQVTDNGTPALSTNKSFTVVVNTDPLGVMSDALSAFIPADDLITVTWPAVPGRVYQVQYKGPDGEWMALNVPMIVSEEEGAITVSGGSQETEYRIIDLSAPLQEQ